MKDLIWYICVGILWSVFTFRVNTVLFPDSSWWKLNISLITNFLIWPIAMLCAIKILKKL